MDPSAEEESCSVISLIVGVSGNKNYYTTGEGDLKETEGKCTTIGMNGPGSVAPKTLKEAINQGMYVFLDWLLIFYYFQT